MSDENTLAEKVAEGAPLKTTRRWKVQVTDDPKMQKRIFNRTMARLRTEFAPRAWRQLTRWMDDENLPIRDRIRCAVMIIEKAGYVTPKASNNDLTEVEKSLDALSPEELHARLMLIENELSARAAPVVAAFEQSNNLLD